MKRKNLYNYFQFILKSIEQKIKFYKTNVKTKGGFSVLSFSMCLSLGVLYGIIFDNIALGLLGVAIGLCFGAIVKKKK